MTDLASETGAIQRDIDATRSRIDERLSALETKLTPGQIMDELMGFVRGNDASVFTQDLMESVKGNPLPAALTGIGLAWLMASNQKSQTTPAPMPSSGVHVDKAHGSPAVAPGAAMPALPWKTAVDFDRHLAQVDSSVTRNAADDDTAHHGRLNDARGKALGLARREDETHEGFGTRISHTIDSTRQTLMDTAKGVADKVAGLAGQVSDAAQSAAGTVGEKAQAMPQMASHLMTAVSGNPVLLGAFGLAVGAILGAVVPQSEQETSALKGIADNARHKVAGLAQDVADKGSELAQAGFDAGQDAIKEAGLGGEMKVSELVSDAQSGDLLDSVKKIATDALGAVNKKVSPND